LSEKLVSINDLYEFKDNPYQVKDNEDMEELVESIKQYGIIEPLIVRKRENGGYEILSGHRRKFACEKAGIKQAPVNVRDMDKNMAIITLVDSNLQRSDILPSEKAFAFKMKLEAEKHQGKRTCGQDVHKSRDNIADGISGRQVQRYVRLTELIKPILQMVDDNKMAISPAVELSYLTEDEQKNLLETMESEDCTPSHSQAIRMKELSKQGKLDMDTIFNIMTEEKPNQQEKLQFKVKSLQQYFPKGYTTKQMQDVIEKLLRKYQLQWKNKNLGR
jgi:ParB family chromosome partitioning protein